MPYPKKTTRQTIKELKSERQNANAAAKSKELYPHAQSQLNEAHLLLPTLTKNTMKSVFKFLKKELQ